MELIAKISSKAEKTLDYIVGFILVLVILFAGYSLWNSYMLFSGGFTSDEIMKYKPHITEDGKNPSLWDLMKINEDVVARIKVDDTKIDHPVVKGEDNLEYINKDVYKKFSLPGSIFLDSRNGKDFDDPYSLLYGHHMDRGGMFGDLLLFEDKGFFDKHRTGTLFLPQKTYDIDFFMVCKVDAYDGIIFNPTSIIDLTNRFDLLSYAEKFAINKRDIDLKNDKIIALSTCEKATTNGRTILFGVLREHKGDNNEK